MVVLCRNSNNKKRTEGRDGEMMSDPKTKQEWMQLIKSSVGTNGSCGNFARLRDAKVKKGMSKGEAGRMVLCDVYDRAMKR